MNEINKTIIRFLLGIFGVIFGAIMGGSFIALVMSIDAFVFVKLWAWFIPEIFPSIPLLNYPTAMGVVLIGEVIHPRNKYKGLKTNDYIIAVVAPFISLGIGFIVKSFI